MIHADRQNAKAIVQATKETWTAKPAAVLPRHFAEFHVVDYIRSGRLMTVKVTEQCGDD